MNKSGKFNSPALASFIIIVLALIMVLQRSLLAALFSGLLVYELVHMLAPLLSQKISGARAKMIAVAALSTLVVALLTLAIWGSISFFKSDAGSIHALLQRMADIITTSRDQIPEWLNASIPGDAETLRKSITDWLHEHAIEAKSMGKEAGRLAMHILIGMITGAMVALHDTTDTSHYRPFAAALRDRIATFSHSFKQIVFAQVRIAAINALIVAVYLLIILPLAGIHLPLIKSMIAITFFAGLLPVAGNLISNTVLVVVALSHSLHTAVASLLFMVIIHKLEYFLNAKIIGSRINSRAWELLIAMVVMESVYGVSGVIAAPVFYAYLKKELMDHQLV